MSVRCSSKKDAMSFIMAFQSGCRLEDLAVPLPSLRRCFVNNNTICSLFYLFCFFVYLVASINKLEPELELKQSTKVLKPKFYSMHGG